MWKRVLREYFAFPKKERRGLWVLFMIWLIVLAYHIYKSREFEYLYHDVDYSIVVSEELNKYDYHRDSVSNEHVIKYKFRVKPFKYLNDDDFEFMKLSLYQIEIIKRIQESSVSMYTRSDLDNCKELDSSLKQKIIQYVKIYPEKKYFIEPNFTLKNKEIYELNTADTLALDKIKGISEGLSKRILKYREKLGGYKNHEQLKEVWGMDSFSYVQLLKQTHIDTQIIHRININTADMEELGKHPYIGYKLAKLIVNYRIQHGAYTKIEDLWKIKVMNENIFSKIETYISVKND